MDDGFRRSRAIGIVPPPRAQRQLGAMAAPDRPPPIGSGHGARSGRSRWMVKTSDARSARAKRERKSARGVAPHKARSAPADGWISVGLVAVAALIYGRTAGHGFVTYDDLGYFVQNPHVATGL